MPLLPLERVYLDITGDYIELMKSQKHILIVDDEKDICDLVSEILEDEGYQVSVAYNGEEARAIKKEVNPDLILLDIWMPDVDGISLLQEWRSEENLSPVIMMSGHGTLEHAIEATKLGASDFLEKPLTLAKLLMVVEKTLTESVTQSPIIIEPSEPNLNEKPYPFKPIGRSLLMDELNKNLMAIAESTPQHLLLLSEYGSEVDGIASYLHDIGSRNNEPFIELNLKGVTSESLNALFYGRSGGAGLIHHTPKATLYIKQLETLDSEPQEALLSLLNQSTFINKEENQLQAFDYQFIFSAHKNLDRETKEGDFNLALWHKVSEVIVDIPPLSAHSEDVPDLIAYYLHYFTNEEHLTYRHFSIAAQNRLRNHKWLGNHLELRNLVKQLLLLGKHEEVTLDEVNLALEKEYSSQQLVQGEQHPLPLHLSLRKAREEFERNYLIAQYERAEGNIANLADLVGMERTNLYRKLKSLEIDPKTGKVRK